MSARGDRERDVAALERELASEHRRKARHATTDAELRVLTLMADLHLHAAGLLEELASVYDDLDDQHAPNRLRRTSQAM